MPGGTGSSREQGSAAVKEFKDRVAVVTGAASGIGRALAETFAGAGMKVVLSDVEEAALAAAADTLKLSGAEMLAVQTDVSKPDQVEELARISVDTFGGVHVLCNNAGVAVGRVATWESTLDDWRWILGVNLMGVVHGIRSFIPRMLEQDSEGHIVNTASMAGLVTAGGNGLYSVTKHAVVSLSESIYNELAGRGSKLKVSVVCPGWVNTELMDSDRNRPPELGEVATSELPPEQVEALEEMMRNILEGGLDPKQVAELVLDSIREERFYVLPHPDWGYMIEHRLTNILEQREPSMLPPPGMEGMLELMQRG
jgi:NAD(P)-dependent dehydrogenase (short-subunit alcohol dehydrogenase family)